MFQRRSRIELKSPAQIELMRGAGLVVAEALATMREAAVPGATTRELDTLARDVLARAGATSSFLDYVISPGVPPFPAVICASVNDRVVHGFPDDVPLAAGDVLSIDMGAVLAGWHGDAAITVAVGGVAGGVVSAEAAELIRVTEEALWRGIEAAQVGAHLTDIGAAIEQYVRSQGAYGLIEEYGGHGIGTEMHMDPHVMNHGRAGQGPRLREGMALAIEPMLTLGSRHTDVLDDDWTVVTIDGSLAAHFEHSIAITADGPRVLTAGEGEDRPARLQSTA